MKYSEKEIARQGRRLQTLEDSERALINAITVFRTRECDYEDSDLYKATVQLELRLKKRIAEVSSRLMYMKQEAIKEEIA